MDFSAYPLELKALGDAGQIEGLAAGYGNVDLGGDVVARGAFAASLIAHKAAGTMPAMLLYHDPKRPIGRWESFAESDAGLVAKGRITLDSTDGRSAYALLRDKALTGMSIGYRVKQASAGIKGTRVIETAQLAEVSLVTFPMNDLTRVSSVKSLASIRDLETLLNEAGMSNRKAKVAAAAAWRAIEGKSDEDAAERRAAEILTNAISALSKKG